MFWIYDQRPLRRGSGDHNGRAVIPCPWLSGWAFYVERPFITARVQLSTPGGPSPQMVAFRSSLRRFAQQAVKTAALGVDQVLPPKRGAVVLIYHRVGRASQLEVDLPDSLFDEQMAMLADQRRAATLDAALASVAAVAPVTSVTGGPGPKGDIDPVVVTFDDGTADFVDRALPILVRHGVPAVLYVATDFVEAQRSFPDAGRPVSWSGLRDALSTGLVTIGSHTHTHALLDRLAPAAVAHELDRSIELIQDRLDIAAEHFAYPKALSGHSDAAAAVRTRFRSAAVAGTRPNPYGATDAYNLLRSPVQLADGMKWFERKVLGGMRAEDDLRRLANRVRYVGATQ